MLLFATHVLLSFIDQTKMSDITDLSELPPSTTTISTVAVQSGRSKVILAILRVSKEFIVSGAKVKIASMIVKTLLQGVFIMGIQKGGGLFLISTIYVKC